MSIVAICSAADVASVNADLDALDVTPSLGPENFTIPIYDGGARASHATLHCWPDNTDLLAALQADERVTVDIAGTGTPRERVQALVEAQGLAWPDNAPMLPDSGTIQPGEYYRNIRGDDTETWRVIQAHDRGVFGGDPETYPALIRRARRPGEAAPWVQPIDQFDAYLTLDPFTGEGELVTYSGDVWRCDNGSAGGPGGSLLNSWAPGVFGWTQL